MFLQTEYCFLLLHKQEKTNQSHHMGNAWISHQIRENATKPILWGIPWKLVPIFFP